MHEKPYSGYNDELEHFGVKGMKWGVRRYQNPDGTLTDAGKKKRAEDVKRFEKNIRSGLRAENKIRGPLSSIIYGRKMGSSITKGYSAINSLFNKYGDSFLNDLDSKYEKTARNYMRDLGLVEKETPGQNGPYLDPKRKKNPNVRTR